MSASLKIEVSPGDDILTSFEEATRLANKLDVTIEFRFNDVTCLAFPGGSPEKGYRGYHLTLERKDKYPLATNV